MKKGLAVNDQHIPYEDKKLNDLLIDKFIPEFKPDYIDILGDLTDFYQISKFRNNPSRKHTIQEDIDATKIYLQRVRDAAPQAEITLHFGNHMCRLKKYIWDKAPELDCLNAIDMRVLLDIDSMKIKCIETEQGYTTRGKLVMTHGTVVSQDSAMTARRNLQKYGMSVMCGHTHRLGATYKTDCRGTIGAWENGCLCEVDLIKEWGQELANWQQGFSLIFFSDRKDQRFHVEPILVTNDSFMVGEKIYEQGKREDNQVSVLQQPDNEQKVL